MERSAERSILGLPNLVHLLLGSPGAKKRKMEGRGRQRAAIFILPPIWRISRRCVI
jgi:hypothetical protein